MRNEIYHQYAHSPKLVGLINGLAEGLSPQNSLKAFYDNVFNINSASGSGLDVWGDIFNIKRSLTLTLDNVETQYTMTDDEYRMILKLAASKNISDATCGNIYTVLSTVFSQFGNIYVSDLGEMHLRYSFEFLLSDTMYAILRQTKVVPRPAGVGIEIYEIPSRKIIGFNGQELETLNNGTFFQGVRNE